MRLNVFLIIFWGLMRDENLMTDLRDRPTSYGYVLTTVLYLALQTLAWSNVGLEL